MKRIHISRALVPICVGVLILMQALMSLSAEENGFLRFDGWANMIRGRPGFYEAPAIGRMELAAQSISFLSAHVAFRGYKPFVIDRTNHLRERIYMPFLSKSLWFLGPFYAIWTLNILVWFLACFAAREITQALTPSRIAPNLALFLTVFVPGFAVLFIEPAPYVLAVGSGFLLIGLACKLRIWRPKESPADLALVHLFAALLILGYGSAALHLPVIMGLTLLRVRNEIRENTGIFSRQSKFHSLLSLTTGWSSRYRESALCLSIPVLLVLVFVVLPIVIYNFVVVPNDPSSMFPNYLHTLQSMFFMGHRDTIAVLHRPNAILTAAIAAGPVITVATIVAVASAIRQKQWLIVIVAAILVAQLYAIVIVINFYVTSYPLFVQPATLFTVLAAIGFSVLWEHRRFFSRALAVVLLAAIPLWINLPLIGYKPPLFMYSVGVAAFFDDPYRADYATRFFE